MIGNSLKRFGQAVEQAGLEVRSYFLPSHWRTYRELIRSHRRVPDTERQFAYLNFTSARIDNVSGRYLFALVRDLEAAGLAICYQDNFPFIASFRQRLFKKALLNRPFQICRSKAELPKGSVAVEVTDDPSVPPEPGVRRIRVRYEEVWPAAEHQVPMSFFVHPGIYDRLLATPQPDRAASRSWRVLFAGRAADPKYRANVIGKKFGKMSRSEILGALEAGLPPERLVRLTSAADLESTRVRQSAFVWADAGRFNIARELWLPTLARADFFLACPGKDMPLCHNLIEALSQGTVPILEHPEFLDPPLAHGVNCLVFRGPSELLTAFDHAFQLNQEEIARLRSAAYDYYRKHLAPGMFARRLLNSPHACLELFLNAYRIPRLAAPRR